MIEALGCSERQGMLIPFIITVSGGTPTMTEGGNFLSVTDGGVGIYTLAFGGQYGMASARTPVILGVTALSTTGNELIANVVEASVATTGFSIEVNDDAGTATDTTVHGAVMWFGSADRK